MALPDPVHGRFAHSLGFGHRAAAPVRGSRRLGLERRVHNPLDILLSQRRFASPPLSHFPQAIGALADESLPPQSHRLEIEAQVIRDKLVLLSLRGG